MAGTSVGSIFYDLNLDDSKFKKGIADAKSTAAGFGSSLGGAMDKAKTGSFALLGGLTAAGAAAGVFGLKSVQAFNESQQATAQLEAVLKSTGGVAGVTKEEVLKYSDQVMNMSGVSDEAATGMQSMLLTFTNIGKDVFPMAADAALDMATAMNGGAIPSAEELRQQSIQLGKALQDPDQGLGALKRVGVNVDELSKKFTAGMSIQEKQKLILAELSTEFGGSAKAAGQTFGGQLNIAKEKFNNLMESVGEAIVSKMQPLVEGFNRWFDSVGGVDGVMNKLKETWEKISPYLPEIAGAIAFGLVPAMWSLAASVWATVAPLIPFMAIGAAAVFLFTKHREVFYALAIALGVVGLVILIGLLPALWGAVTAFAAVAIAELAAMWPLLLLGAAVAVVAYLFIKYWGQIKNAVHNAAVWIGNFSASIVGAIINAANWVTTKVNQINNWFRSIPGAIGGALGNLWGAITSPFRAAFDWVIEKANAVKNALKKLNPFHRESPSLFDMVSLGTKAITSSYGEMFDKLSGMAISVKPDLSGALAGGGNKNITASPTSNNFYGDFNFKDKGDIDYFIKKLNRNQELAENGLALT